MKAARLALALAALAACARHRPPPAPAPPPGTVWLTAGQVTAAGVAVAPVSEHELASDVAASGRLAFQDLRVAHVFSPVTGRVIGIQAQLGQRVRKGDALATIDSPDVGTAFSDLAKAQAELVAAAREHERQREMAAVHAAARRELEDSASSLARARAELRRAREKAELLRAGGVEGAESDYTLRAPIDGEVVSRQVSPGSEVQGQYGGGTAVELFTIGDLDTIVLWAEVFEMDLGRVHPDAPLTLTVPAYPGRRFGGRVAWIAPRLDPTTRAARIRAELPNPGHLLKAEMFAAVSISAPPRPTLAVPRAAVLRLGEQQIAFVELGAAPGGRRAFERRPVTVDEDAAAGMLPVRAGLVAGELLVVHGAVLLSGMVR